MSALLEHDDIKKSRRALIISSVVVIALHYVQLKTDYIEILKLQVVVSKDSLVVAAKLSTAYLLYIFILRVVKINIETTIETAHEFIKKLYQDADEKIAEAKRNAAVISINTRGGNVDDFERETKERIASETRKLVANLKLGKALDSTVEILTDVVPAIILAVLALTNAHTVLYDNWHQSRISSQDQAVIEAPVDEPDQDATISE